MAILDTFVGALGRVRTITRGPKPAAAMHALGLRPTLPTRIPTSQGIIAELADEDLRGRRVGVQLYAENASQDLVAFLGERGAKVLPVAPYAYVAGTDDHRVVELIDKLSAGAIDAVAFTSSAQVDRVFQVADQRQSSAALVRALEHVVVAAVGPTCAASLRKRGVGVTVVPERSFFMKTLVGELTRALAPDSSLHGSG
jgi:uroporphyrinogen-III synthase